MYADITGRTRIDAAILAILKDDAILSALMPGGVHWGIGPGGVTRFVTVFHQDSAIELALGATDGGNERFSYQIIARARTPTGDEPLDAAARIHDLLHKQPLSFAGTGYEYMAVYRTERIRFSDRDSNNAEWQHVGGVYDVIVCSELPVIN